MIGRRIARADILKTEFTSGQTDSKIHYFIGISYRYKLFYIHLIPPPKSQNKH